MIVGVSFYESSLSQHAEDLRRSFAEVGVPSDVVEVPGGSVDRATFVRTMLDQYKGFDVLYVDVGGLVRDSLDIFRSPDFDLAAYVYQSSGASVLPSTMRFMGIGYIWTGTMFWRNNDASRQVLDRWRLENQENPTRTERENLLYFLAECPIRFRYLPAEYHWVEKVMRPLAPRATPIVEHPVPFRVAGGTLPRLKLAERKTVQQPHEPTGRQLLWSGHFLDHSGYGKANRELLHRVANTYRISIPRDELDKEGVFVDEYVRALVDAHKAVRVAATAPYLRFFGPREEARRGRKTCFTMMETRGLHEDLVRLLNGYDEVLVPTAWNKQVFEEAGVRPRVRTVPLGVDQHNYRPGPRGKLPPARLLTTDRAGDSEIPEGFLFVNVSNPSFRKGIDVAVRAFEEAFAGDPDAALVFCVSYSNMDSASPGELVRGGLAACRSRIYVLEGKFSEEQMAGIYRACDGYICASRGEGFGLPLVEASACGLPVVAPRAFSYAEFLTQENSFLFEPDGFRKIPGGERISPWYKDQEFVHYGDRAIDEFSERLREVRTNSPRAVLRAAALRTRILSRYTWDAAAGELMQALMEGKP